MHDVGHIKHVDNIHSAHDDTHIKIILCLSHIYKTSGYLLCMTIKQKYDIPWS